MTVGTTNHKRLFCLPQKSTEEDLNHGTKNIYIYAHIEKSSRNECRKKNSPHQLSLSRIQFGQMLIFGEPKSYTHTHARTVHHFNQCRSICSANGSIRYDGKPK